ncbi:MULTISPECIES: magnesium/cobalt transporter CorA [unclassified Lentimonas]|uniref:magnesium/cobalt transporter CorA n=1 Tax=unclassified Lentimonas TaxID=2630993 RepID=UPI001321D974|nr:MULTISPECIES: magnesium/cobalt transporter CorA [unclassified Lentimonas]CAA6678676.1 Magnesium and cobalt transport protein CorA [Lentimonas sp. CC4]CAA6683662.1 Magnesium and cobalt transport protein CorA [Lentimonas sp. CC6]CAA7074491.1 Magnesium and cobalt transport protein CorA [Lentimonas sp. CC4]CAA7169103.1 Magnesium and cobalt transport protein CorA [Lentimonas sp. CC21]CAA7180491.1 Magnesium and cobalt transport protein CorA [Lentimonas sp. CC8]
MNPAPDSSNTNKKRSTGAKKKRSAVGSAIRALGRGLSHAGKAIHTKPVRPTPGGSPGIEQYLHNDTKEVPFKITTVDYGRDFHDARSDVSLEQALNSPRKEGQRVRWINIDGLNPHVIDVVCKHFGVHTLVAEDTLSIHMRPKIEVFKDYLQIVARQHYHKQNELKNEQVSIFLFKDTLLSFQEHAGDVFDPIRKRLMNHDSRFRSNQADYLCYALLDSIVDHLFPIQESYTNDLEELEDRILEAPTAECQQSLFSMKHDLSRQRRALWALREVIDGLYRTESPLIGHDLKPFLRDVQDHTIQLIDLISNARDTAASLGDLYQTSVSNKMNEIMKVLTLMSSFFIPMTFLAGVYGMNFKYIPELDWKYSYATFWLICLISCTSLLIFFRRKGWIGQRR